MSTKNTHNYCEDIKSNTNTNNKTSIIGKDNKYNNLIILTKYIFYLETNTTFPVTIDLHESQIEIDYLNKRIKLMTTLIEEDMKEQLGGDIQVNEGQTNQNLKINYENFDVEKFNNNKNTIEIADNTARGKMMKKIEEFIEKNMSEMHNEIISIKSNYEEEILQLMGLDDVYGQLRDSITEEMNNEVENMKAQYEILRIKGIESITNKYKYKKNKLKRLSLGSVQG
jgi:hypothetical protein